jgi:hypothetical protein
LVGELYRAAAEMQERLTEDHLLLFEQWVNAYAHIAEPVLEQIKKETRMEFVATTISEHIFHEGEVKGRAEGEAKGEVKGQIKLLEMLYQLGIVSEDQFQRMIEPLRQQLAKLTESA